MKICIILIIFITFYARKGNTDGQHSYSMEIKNFNYQYNEKRLKVCAFNLVKYNGHNAVNGTMIFADDLEDFDLYISVVAPRKSKPWTLINSTFNGCKSVKMSTNETSDTESADIKATSTATTATTAAVSELDANAPVNNESGSSNISTNTNTGNKKSKRLPSFSAIFKRMNERDILNRRKNNDQDVNVEVEGLTPASKTTQTSKQLKTDGSDNTDGNDNQPKEDKQLVYAELVLKPSENNEPLPAKNSTEYAEIVYVKKDENLK